MRPSATNEAVLQAKQAEHAEQQLPSGQPASGPTAVTTAEAVSASAANLEAIASSVPEQSAADAKAAATSEVAADVSLSVPAPAVASHKGLHAEAAYKPVSSDGPGVSSSPSSADVATGVRASVHAFDDGAECIVCWEARACLMMQPCGHICVCSGCAAMLRDTLCPMCRTEVASRLLVKL